MSMNLLLERLEEERKRRGEVLKTKTDLKAILIESGERGATIKAINDLIKEVQNEKSAIEKITARIIEKKDEVKVVSEKTPIGIETLEGKYLIVVLIAFKEKDSNCEEEYFLKSNIKKYLPFMIFNDIFNIDQDIKNMLMKGERKKTYSLEIKKINVLNLE